MTNGQVDQSHADMNAVRLHGPRDLRVERIPVPGLPGPGQVLLRVRATGLCGSDLHSYQDARIGDTPVLKPLVLGHEFAGTVEAVGSGVLDGNFKQLIPGTRVAVDPAQPCGQCEPCETGNPNLCLRIHFCGNYPDGGSLCEWMHMPARACFPLPPTLDYTQGALLEPLGVALHAVGFARIKPGCSVAILGAGPIGLLILQAARLAGADPVFISDILPARLVAAVKFGGQPLDATRSNPVEAVLNATSGRGVDVAVEAAWAGTTINQAAEMVRAGGRLVLVGIPSDDALSLRHSVARRKGLTIFLSRRMKLIYPRAIQLAERGQVDLLGLVSHRFPLSAAPDAFAMNTAYVDNVVKVVIES